jgi:hypothetical protein
MKDKIRLVIAGIILCVVTGVSGLALIICYQFSNTPNSMPGIGWVIAGWIGFIIVLILFLIGLGLIFLPKSLFYKNNA